MPVVETTCPVPARPLATSKIPLALLTFVPLRLIDSKRTQPVVFLALICSHAPFLLIISILSPRARLPTVLASLNGSAVMESAFKAAPISAANVC